MTPPAKSNFLKEFASGKAVPQIITGSADLFR